MHCTTHVPRSLRGLDVLLSIEQAGCASRQHQWPSTCNSTASAQHRPVSRRYTCMLAAHTHMPRNSLHHACSARDDLSTTHTHLMGRVHSMQRSARLPSRLPALPRLCDPRRSRPVHDNRREELGVSISPHTVLAACSTPHPPIRVHLPSLRGSQAPSGLALPRHQSSRARACSHRSRL